MEKEVISKLQRKLPDWAVKPHPTKKNMSAIHPMAVIDQLNDAFGVGEWKFETAFIHFEPFIQKTQKGERDMFRTAVKGTLIVPKFDIHIEQFGGSSNDDLGDALKGGATDALTKCASYLGVGASIYKNQGNVEPPKEVTLEEAFVILRAAKTNEELTKAFRSLPANLQKDEEVVALGKELREEIID